MNAVCTSEELSSPRDSSLLTNHRGQKVEDGFLCRILKIHFLVAGLGALRHQRGENISPHFFENVPKLNIFQ